MKKSFVYKTITCLAATLAFGVGWKTTDSVGQRSFSAAGVACSADGRVVYAADLHQLWKSDDGRKTWSEVLLHWQSN
jgi:hypothetical protein